MTILLRRRPAALVAGGAAGAFVSRPRPIKGSTRCRLWLRPEGGERCFALVGVETLLYDLEADKLVWAGQSETMNPSKAESFVRELIQAVGNELQKDGVVGPAQT